MKKHGFREDFQEIAARSSQKRKDKMVPRLHEARNRSGSGCEVPY
jgi:hypothetical protein